MLCYGAARNAAVLALCVRSMASYGSHLKACAQQLLLTLHVQLASNGAQHVGGHAVKA